VWKGGLNRCVFEYTEKQTWLGAFTSKLVDNVQISIKNIHCRYEDNLSTPNVSRISLKNIAMNIEVTHVPPAMIGNRAAPFCRWIHTFRVQSGINGRELGGSVHSKLVGGGQKGEDTRRGSIRLVRAALILTEFEIARELGRPVTIL
jgi:hypothetical protein